MPFVVHAFVPTALVSGCDLSPGFEYPRIGMLSRFVFMLGQLYFSCVRLPLGVLISLVSLVLMAAYCLVLTQRVL